MAVLFVRQIGIGLAVGVVVGVAAVWALRRVTPRHRRPVPGGDARRRRAGLRRRRRPARLGLPRRLPRRAGAGHGRHPRPADRDVLPPGPGVGRPGGDVRRARACSSSPADLDDVAVRGTVLALVLVFVSRPVAVAIVDRCRRASRGASALVLSARRAARRRARRARHLPGHRRGRAAARSSSTSSSSRCCSRRSSRATTFEPLARGARRDDQRAGAAAPAGRGGDDQARWGRRSSSTRSPEDDAVVGARVRDLGLPREAVVNVIVRDDEAIPPRGSTVLRAGDRLHVLLRSELSRDVHRHRRALAQGADRAAAAAARGGMQGRPPTFTRGAVRARSPLNGDAAHPSAVAGDRGGRPAARAPRRARRARRPRRRALRDGRPARGGRRAPAAVGAGRRAGCGACRPTTAERAWLQNVVGALAADMQE